MTLRLTKTSAAEARPRAAMDAERMGRLEVRLTAERAVFSVEAEAVDAGSLRTACGGHVTGRPAIGLSAVRPVELKPHMPFVDLALASDVALRSEL
ncbi:MAG: hypothetical protein ACJ8AW_40815 [Rhodopila sp.]